MQPPGPTCMWLKGCFGLVPGQVAALHIHTGGPHEGSGLEGGVHLTWGDTMSTCECDRWGQRQ